MKSWPITRDVMLFFGGLAGVIHEAVFTTLERPTLLIVFAAMMGLPIVMKADERRRNGNGK